MLSPERVALIQEAKRLHGRICVIRTCSCYQDSFTVSRGTLMFWFEDRGGSSHVTVLEV